VYGLKDGPKLFIDMLTNWVKNEGWEQSLLDDQVFYFRTTVKVASGKGKTTRLEGMLSIHMDDLAMTGSDRCLRNMVARLKECFGKHAEVKVQRINFRHLGFKYEWLADGSYTMDLKQYIRDAVFAEVLGDLDAVMPPRGISNLRGGNGTLSYACGGRPEAMGAVSESMGAVAVGPEGEEPRWAAVAAANDILAWLKETNEDSQFWYPILGDGSGFTPGTTSSSFGLLVLTDAAFANLQSRYSQLGYVILLVELLDSTQLGGMCHVLEFGSGKSPRVCTSTFSGELQAALRGLERGRLLQHWMTELWCGAQTAEELLSLEPVLPLDSVVDAKGLFDALAAPTMGKITDKNTVLYLLSYREQMRARVLRKLNWAPTESMLADDLTKWMIEGSGLWEVLYQTGTWQPFARPELPEDWVTWDGADGSVTRYRLGNVLKEYPPKPKSRPIDDAARL